MQVIVHFKDLSIWTLNTHTKKNEKNEKVWAKKNLIGNVIIAWPQKYIIIKSDSMTYPD